MFSNANEMQGIEFHAGYAYWWTKGRPPEVNLMDRGPMGVDTKGDGNIVDMGEWRVIDVYEADDDLWYIKLEPVAKR